MKNVKIVISLLCASAFMSLLSGYANEKDNISYQWGKYLSRHNIVPTYPLTEDIQVGDIFLQKPRQSTPQRMASIDFSHELASLYGSGLPTVLVTGSTLPQYYVLPKGTILSQDLSLPSGLTLPKDVVLPAGTVLPIGTAWTSTELAAFKNPRGVTAGIALAGNYQLPNAVKLDNSLVLSSTLKLGGVVTLPNAVSVPQPWTLDQPIWLPDNLAPRFAFPSTTNINAKQLTLGVGSILSSNYIIPKGSVLSRNLSLPPGLTLPKDMVLPAGTVLPIGTIWTSIELTAFKNPGGVIAGTALAANYQFPNSVELDNSLVLSSTLQLGGVVTLPDSVSVPQPWTLDQPISLFINPQPQGRANIFAGNTVNNRYLRLVQFPDFYISSHLEAGAQAGWVQNIISAALGVQFANARNISVSIPYAETYGIDYLTAMKRIVELDPSLQGGYLAGSPKGIPPRLYSGETYGVDPIIQQLGALDDTQYRPHADTLSTRYAAAYETSSSVTTAAVTRRDLYGKEKKLFVLRHFVPAIASGDLLIDRFNHGADSYRYSLVTEVFLAREMDVSIETNQGFAAQGTALANVKIMNDAVSQLLTAAIKSTTKQNSAEYLKAVNEAVPLLTQMNNLMNSINTDLGLSNSPGIGLKVTSISGNTIKMKVTFERPLVFGYRGLSFGYNSDGKLAPSKFRFINAEEFDTFN